MKANYIIKSHSLLTGSNRNVSPVMNSEATSMENVILLPRVTKLPTQNDKR